MPDSVFVDLYCGLWARLFGLERYARRPSPGQMTLFGGEHDVKDEPRDAHGQWTAGAAAPKKSADSARSNIERPDSRATITQRAQSKPATGSPSMSTIQTKTKGGAQVTLKPKHYGVDFEAGGVSGSIYAWDEKAGGAKGLGPYSRPVLLTISREDYDAAMAAHGQLKAEKDAELAATPSPGRGTDNDILDKLPTERTRLRPSRSPDPMSGLSEQQAVDAMLGEPVYDDPSYGPKSQKPDVVPAADVATLRQDETKPALEEKPMSAYQTVDGVDLPGVPGKIVVARKPDGTIVQVGKSALEDEGYGALEKDLKDKLATLRILHRTHPDALWSIEDGEWVDDTGTGPKTGLHIQKAFYPWRLARGGHTEKSQRLAK